MASEIEFENEAIILLQRNLYMKKDDFVQALEKQNKDKVGFSRPTIYKKLAVMITEKTIAELPFESLPNYGIVETNRRSVYIILKRSTQIKEYLDSIFELLLKGDDIDREVILKEIVSYKKQYSLDAKQLDVLIELLDKTHMPVLETIVSIIYDWIVKFRRSPNNKEKLITSLKQILKDHPEPQNMPGNLRRYSICLLGWFKQDVVFDQFVKDIRTIEAVNLIEGEYMYEFTAEILEKNRRALFDLEREMLKEVQKANAKGDLQTANLFTNKAGCIRRVKFRAMMLLNLADDEFAEQVEEQTRAMEESDKQKEGKLVRALKEALREP